MLTVSVVFVLWYRIVSSEGADCVFCVCVCVCELWYKNVSSEWLTGSVVFVCVLWYRNVSSVWLTGSVVFHLFVMV